MKKINYEKSKLPDNNNNICNSNDEDDNSYNSNIYSSVNDSSVSSSDFEIYEESYQSSK